MHDFPSVHKDFFVKRLGMDRIEQLEIIARSDNKPDLTVIEAELKTKLKELTQIGFDALQSKSGGR